MSSKAGTGLMVVGAAAVGLVLGVVAMREGLIPGLGAEAAKPAADPTPKKPVASERGVLVQTASVSAGSLSVAVEMLGSVQWVPGTAVAVSLGSEVTVSAVLAQPGQPVTPKTPVLRVKPSPAAQGELDSAKAAQQAAEAMLAEARARLDAGLGTRSEVVQGEQDLHTAEVSVASIQRTLPPTDGVVTAGVAGMLTGVEVSTGTLVSADGALFEVSPSDQLAVRFGVPLAHADSIAVGTPLEVVALLSGDPGATSLSLARLEPSLNPDSRALTAWTGALSGARCRPGTPVRLSVRIESPPGLLVSRGAVVLSDDGPAVYTTSDGVAHRHAVEILAGDAQTVCLRSETLADGDRVVILGGHELEDGSPVRVEGGP